MKNNDIQPLLERYCEGTLSDSELAELGRLTGRDEVMATAIHRAAGIRRRRRTALFTVAGLLLAGTAVWSLLPRQESPLVAEAVVPEAVTLPEPAVEQATPADSPVPATPAKSVHRTAVARPVTVAPTRQATKEEVSEEPVVICNNQCEADSVINDIWKFLTV